MSTTLTRNDITAAFKTDLHRHVDGAMAPKLILDLSNESGVILPTYNLAKFTKLCQVVEPKGMAPDDLFQRFGWAIAVMRTPKGLYQAAYNQVLDLARENIFYAELRFAPGYHSIYPAPWYKPRMYEKKPFPIMSLHETVEIVLNGLKQAMWDTGIEVNLILCIPRESLFTPGQGKESVEAIVELALRFQKQGVVGLDLACNEETYPPDPYIEYFLKTEKTNIGTCPHAGEMGTDEQRLKNIATCIQKINPGSKKRKRIGHAIDIWRSGELMGLAKEENIGIERTPLSTGERCSLADGHLDVLLENNVPAVITSDDPALMRASLTDNWMAALNYHSFGEKEFWQLTANGVNTAFYRDARQRARVREMFVRFGLSPSLLTD